MDRADFDSAMMANALRMAKRGLGTTAPNPSVGAVIADEATGEVIARGWTQPGGRPHAETEALRRAGARARGATMVVTLEPCAHHGKTPPCADAIIAAGPKRVVVGAGDPDPRTAGQGIARLRAAGMEVTEGILESEARWTALGHILRVTESLSSGEIVAVRGGPAQRSRPVIGRPFVQLKLALSADGRIARGDGNPVWVTGPEARAAAHLLRAEADAVLVGRGTVEADDPELTCRLPGLEHRSPLRCVLDTKFRISPEARLVKTAPKYPLNIFTAESADSTSPAREDEHLAAVTRDLVARGIGVMGFLPEANGRVPLLQVLHALSETGVTRLLVEGGPAVWRSFADAGVADEVVLFMAPGNEMSQVERDNRVRRALHDQLGELPLTLIERRRIGVDGMWRLQHRRWSGKDSRSLPGF